MQNAKPRAIAFDAFGTLIRYGGARLNPYRRLLADREQVRTERLPFLTRNVPADAFAAELGLAQVMPEFRRELIEELAGLRLYDEVVTALTRVREAGLRVAVCSNLAFEYGPAVRRLLPDLDAYVFSFEVGARKPEPAIYAVTCAALNAAPGEVAFIGDSIRCDVHGPQAFGMQACWVDRRGGQSLLDALEGIV